MRMISIVFMFVLLWVTTINAQKVPVILTAGQSNADGRVTMDDLPDELKEYKYCLWSYGSGDFETASGEFSLYFPRVAKPKIEQSWGFDAVVYKQLELLWQRPFYVIKHTDGGTAIDPSCKSSTHGLYWSADTAFLSHTVSASHGGKSLLKAFERQIDNCLPHLPKNYDIKVLIWHQGESDQSAADRYYDNLKAVIAHIRQHLVEKTGKRKYANLPVVCGTFSKESRQGCQQVADALYRLSREDKNFYVVEATDLSLLSDHLHFNARGAQILGQRVGGAIITANDNMGELAFLYVKVGVQSKGIGQSIWKAIESMHPEIEVWETCTPYFDRRNIHFYINRLGFHAVEFFNEHHPDPHKPEQFDQEDGLFKFEKRMK